VLIAACFGAKILQFCGLAPDLLSGINNETGVKTLVDFDVFYLAAQMVWRGEIQQAYHFASMGPLQEALSGEATFMPWTYPPLFDLMIAPLAFLPRGIAYLVFTGGTLVAYLWTVKVIAGRNFNAVLLLLFPTIMITMACGQNGFLTGTFIGLTCLGFRSNRVLAGVPLGLMIIKPHLAVSFAVYTLLARQWGVAAVAVATVLLTSGLATALLGPGIWVAFLEGVREAQAFLKAGIYPLYRMISPYAAVLTFGATATVGMLVQIVTATISLAAVAAAYFKGFALKQLLGLTAIVSVLISPYAYDYDLTIFGIGIALLLPEIARVGRRNEQTSFYLLSFATGAFGLVQTKLMISVTSEEMPVSLAAVALIALLGVVWRVLDRSRRERTDATTVLDSHQDGPAAYVTHRA